MNVFAIVNPLSGAGADPDVAAERVALLTERFAGEGVDGVVHLTERRHHARDLARAALASGASIVIVWGGDGTINEVASVVAGSRSALGVIPGGPGDGFAGEPRVPAGPHGA